MRHFVAGNRLGRKSSWRKATIRDIARAALERQRICTTKAKAKEARKMVDRLITLGKKGQLVHKRRAFAILGDHQLVSELFRRTAPRFKNRNGGYTRIIPLSLRRGDNAQLVYLEITEKDEQALSKSRSTATAKPKDLTPLPQKPAPKVEEPVAAEPAKEKPKFKLPFRRGAEQESSKPGKKISGGIKKFFRRKSGESS